MVEFEDFVGSKFEPYVAKSELHSALKLIAWGKLTFDARVDLHRVVSRPRYGQVALQHREYRFDQLSE